MVGELSETVMVLIRNDLLAHLPTQFSGISSCEIPFATMSVFTKNHVMHSHLTSRLPSAYEMHCDVISKTHITHANISPCIYSHNLNHTIMLCNFSFHHIKISSRGLMIKHKQFYLNHSTKHINSQKLFCEHCFRNSKTLGHCSYQNTDYRFTL